jgi:hypothetical protein
MVVMALMEAPAIVIEIILIRMFNKKKNKTSMGSIKSKPLLLLEALLLILGSLVIGL